MSCEAKLIQKFREAGLSVVALAVIHTFIYISFFDGISAIAKKTPSFENGGIFWFTDLSTPESFYILPLVTGFTFWLTSEVLTRNDLSSRMMRLPLFPIIFIVLQAIYNYQIPTSKATFRALILTIVLTLESCGLCLSFVFLQAVCFYLIPCRIYNTIRVIVMRSKQIVKFRSSLGWPDVPVAVSGQQRIMARVISIMREFIDVVKKKDNK